MEKAITEVFCGERDGYEGRKGGNKERKEKLLIRGKVLGMRTVVV